MEILLRNRKTKLGQLSKTFSDWNSDVDDDWISSIFDNGNCDTLLNDHLMTDAVSSYNQSIKLDDISQEFPPNPFQLDCNDRYLDATNYIENHQPDHISIRPVDHNKYNKSTENYVTQNHHSDTTRQISDQTSCVGADTPLSRVPVQVKKQVTTVNDFSRINNTNSLGKSNFGYTSSRLKRHETHDYSAMVFQECSSNYARYPFTPPGSSSNSSDSEQGFPGTSSNIGLGHNFPAPHCTKDESFDNFQAIESSISDFHQQHHFQSPIPLSGVLFLSEEEKRTLLNEGYSIPSRLPLSKQEERNLKKVRRKIKNKVSAQESRRKKKEYLELLERKVDAYSQENGDLHRRMECLETNNRSLLSQLRHLQQRTLSSISSPGGMKPNQTSTAGTCLMVLALCFAVLLSGSSSSGDPTASGYSSPGIHQLGYGPLPKLTSLASINNRLHHLDWIASSNAKVATGSDVVRAGPGMPIYSVSESPSKECRPAMDHGSLGPHIKPPIVEHHLGQSRILGSLAEEELEDSVSFGPKNIWWFLTGQQALADDLKTLENSPLVSAPSLALTGGGLLSLDLHDDQKIRSGLHHPGKFVNTTTRMSSPARF